MCKFNYVQMKCGHLPVYGSHLDELAVRHSVNKNDKCGLPSKCGIKIITEEPKDDSSSSSDYFDCARCRFRDEWLFRINAMVRQTVVDKGPVDMSKCMKEATSMVEEKNKFFDTMWTGLLTVDTIYDKQMGKHICVPVFEEGKAHEALENEETNVKTLMQLVIDRQKSQAREAKRPESAQQRSPFPSEVCLSDTEEGRLSDSALLDSLKF
ncbi:hypothetical protein F4809DRAFT_621876 [Biscogniauxia mediterranea]|nr:hypothetical protein F4809DRAFT_621876 [Biscogniauxia mediterranea]